MTMRPFDSFDIDMQLILAIISVTRFSIWGYIIFGKILYSFSNFFMVLETLFSLLLGKMDDVKGMEEADR